MYLTTKILKRQSAIPFPSRYQLNTVISRHVYDVTYTITQRGKLRNVMSVAPSVNCLIFA